MPLNAFLQDNIIQNLKMDGLDNFVRTSVNCISIITLYEFPLLAMWEHQILRISNNISSISVLFKNWHITFIKSHISYQRTSIPIAKAEHIYWRATG
jgi:hypothetical protein